VVAGAVAATGHLVTARSTATTTDNVNCTLIVPANPLTAQGLATPYQLTATNPADGPCNESNPNQTAFVQGAVIDQSTGQISVYNPVVVDQGTQAAVTPTVPTLPANSVVALWFGFNGATLSFAGADQVSSTASSATATATTATTATATAATSTAAPTSSATAAATAPQGAYVQRAGHHHRKGTATATAVPTATTATATPSATATATSTSPGSVTSPAVTGTQPAAGADTAAASGTPDAILQQNNCIAGEDIAGTFSSFTQVGACNAVAFFQAANNAIAAGQLTVPNPGTATDGQPCETTRNFAIIDQDQSDNVTTEYLANANGQIAQDTAANAAASPNATVLANGSDNGLLDFHVDPALGCTPWKVADLASPGSTATALPLDELQAAAFAGQSGGPAALVPLNDPMVLDNNGNQNADKTNSYRSIVDQATLNAGETPAEYCGDMESIQGVRLQQDVNLLRAAASPAADMADNLFDFLAMRMQQSFTNLNCQDLGLQNDVSTTVDGNGVVVAACFLQQVNAVTPGPGNPTAGMTVCPATTTSGTATASAAASTSSTSAATATATATATPTATASPAATATATPTQTASPNPGGNAASANRKHKHWWW
jgi:hypothetical protein